MFAEDLEFIFVDAGLITQAYIGTNAQIPVGPGEYLSLIETPGSGAEFRQNVAGASMVMPGCQVVVRSTDPVAARALAWQAWDAVIRVRNTFVNGTWYRSIRAMQNPFDDGHDATQGRSRFVFNVIGDKKP